VEYEEGSADSEDDEETVPEFDLEDNDLFDSGVPPEEREKKWEVEAIVNHKYDSKARRMEYLVKWVGDATKTWEPVDNLQSCEHLIRKYRRMRQKALNDPRWVAVGSSGSIDGLPSNIMPISSTSKSFVKGGDDYADYSDEEAKQGKSKYKVKTQAYYNRDHCSRFRTK